MPVEAGPSSDDISVRASGGLVLRGSGDNAELVVIHRERYDDWTLPKGKEDPGETPHQAALREVHEETALRCRITGQAGTARYSVAAGLKRVEYFLMRPYRDTGFVPNDEVDEVRWLPPAAAKDFLTYEFDRSLIAGLDLTSATAASTLHLVRHAAAGDRSGWEGPDELRPLSDKGHRQAAGLTEQTAQVGIERVISSPALRCTMTVEHLAERIGRSVEAHPALAEGAERAATSQLLEVVAGTTTMICSHGDVIPAMLEQLQRAGVRFRSSYACQKGSTWVVGHDGDDYTDAWYIPPP